MASSVTIRGVSKSFVKGAPVLNDIDLEVRRGELFFLLGPSGCGKSTLLRIIAGLTEANAGRIFFNDREVTALPPEKRRSAMVFQNYALWPHLSVFENVAFGLRAAKVPRREVASRVEEVMQLVRLEGFGDRVIGSLSGGQQQRVALARAVVVNPEVLLLDEPLSNLDARLRETMRGEIRRVARERGLTAIYVTHDRREALATADRAAVLHSGTLQQCAEPRVLYSRPANAFVAEFLGEANRVPAEVTGENEVTSALGVWRKIDCKGLIGKVELLFRPEVVRTVPDASPPALAEFRASVAEELYAGEAAAYALEAAGGLRLQMQLSPSPPSPLSGNFRFAVAPEAVLVFAAGK